MAVFPIKEKGLSEMWDNTIFCDNYCVLNKNT